MDDWASVTPHELKSVGGAGLLTRYNGFLGDALQDTFPTMSIDLSKFFLHQRSPAFWKDIATQRKFFQALGNRMGVRKVYLLPLPSSFPPPPPHTKKKHQKKNKKKGFQPLPPPSPPPPKFYTKTNDQLKTKNM